MNALLSLVQNAYEKYSSIVKLAKDGLQSPPILYDENVSDTHVILYELIILIYKQLNLTLKKVNAYFL